MKKISLILSCLCVIAVLAGCSGVDEPSEPGTISEVKTYSVFVQDEYGNPVTGADVRFGSADTASEQNWVARSTNENGMAEFTQGDGKYEVQILELPSGYYANTAAYAIEPGSTLEIIVFRDDGENTDAADTSEVSEIDINIEQEQTQSSVEEKPPAEVVQLAVGDILSFAGQDMNDNAVTSEELFANAKVSMVSLWKTQSEACINEIPDLT